MSKPGVLIVDDTHEARFLAKQILKPQGYPVFEAASGQEALDLLRTNEEIAIVLLDLFLQDMDGFEVMENLKRLKLSRPLKICLVTARRDDDIAREARRSGAAECLFKPLLPDTLLKTVARLMASQGKNP